MFNISSEIDFYHHFSSAVLQSTHNKMQDLLESFKHLFTNLKPNISIEAGEIAKLTVDFDSEKAEASFIEILNLPEKIAKRKKVKLVICIDEFQNLERFKDPLLFQQRLRASWQHHQNVVYVLYGSKRSMLSTIFESQSMPFYRFGDVLYLKKIESSHWIKFIQNSFKKTNKKIAKKYALRITELMENHTYYVQQLSHIVWNNTNMEVTDTIFENSIRDIIGRNAMMFESMFDGLSSNQIKVLHMLIDDTTGKYTGAAQIKKYNLISSANIIQALKALENKEIIDRFEGSPQFNDPVFRMWLRIRVFPK